MIKKILYLFLSLSFIFFIVTTSRGFENNKENIITNQDGSKAFIPYTQENLINGRIKGGHDTLTAEGVQLKKEVHKGDNDEGRKFNLWANEDALPPLRTGAHDEDTNEVVNNIQPDPPVGPNGWGNYLYHYYNPNTDTGLKGVFKSTPERAGDYAQEIRSKLGCKDLSKLSPKDKNKIYDSFGRILHLLQDMGNSAHTNDDIHVFTSSIEDYVKDNWAEIVQSDSFKNAVTPEEYRKGNFDAVNPFHPKALMKTLASVSSSYPTDGFWGKLTDEQVKEQVSNLIPWTTLMTAGYIDAVYKLMSGPGGVDCVEPPPGPSDPAGDHPDDRFDVSDEFYWEKEHKMGEKELADLYLRTAMKKGKMGVWYKKRFMEIFYEGRARYKDATAEIKDAIEADFQAIKNKMEQRKNQAESDWKGAPDVALFTNGFYNPSISLMLKIGEPVSFQDIDFNPEIVKDHPILLVPTGGLYGLENSSSVKAMLEEYVKNGGTLVVLTQQHGYDWEMLPVPVNPETGERKSVKGFGYQEDQSCSFNSVYIDTYHPILSVFSTSTANVGVDGYFTSYPEGSTILLRRTANGQPAMILYPFGNGYVIATTLYTDFAFAHGQANQAEINLVKNIIAWAKKPAELVEIKPQETLSMPVTAKNNTDSGAASLKFSIFDPNRKAISEQTIFQAIGAGQSVTIPVSYTSVASSALGIYHIDYTLLDGQGNIVQPQAETDSGRFAVSNPSKTGTPDKPIWFAVSTSSQEVLFGAPFDYTFHVFNNTDQTPNLTIRNYLRHTARSHQWSIVAAPNQDTTVSGSDLFIDSFWMFETMEAVLYDESEKVIAKYDLSFKGVLPSTSVSVKTDKALYGKSEPVTIHVSLKNNIKSSWQSNAKIIVLDPQSNRIFEEARAFILSPFGSSSSEILFPLPATLNPSTYTVRVEAWFGGSIISSASTQFELVQSQIAVVPNLPLTLNSGINTIPFILDNGGRIGANSGRMDVTLTGPDGAIVYSGSEPFTLAAGESRTLVVPISIPLLTFGNYTLTYTQSDETKAGNPATLFIPSSAIIILSFEEPSYRIREIANLTVKLENTGKFKFENVPVVLSMPDAGITDTKFIDLDPGNNQLLRFAFQIPETTAAGKHDVLVTLTLPGGGSISQNINVTIPNSSLKLKYPGQIDLNAGDTVSLMAENTGGVDTDFTYRVILAGNSVVVYQTTVQDTLQAGAAKNLSFQIPTQATEGVYLLEAEIMDTRTNEKKNLWENFSVSGIRADLSVSTDKEIYFFWENFNILGQMVNQSHGIENANLHLQIVNQCLQQTSYHFFTRDGAAWTERGLLHYGSNYETQLIDLSEYLPDAEGEYKIRIKHAGEDSAQIDYLRLMVDGTIYAPTSAKNISENYSILAEISNADNQAANVLNDEIEVRWETVPQQAAAKILIMGAQEGPINFSCRQYTYWQTDVPVNQEANKSINFTQTVNSLNSPGQFYLKGTLFSRTGQVIAEDEYPFSLIDGSIALSFHPDKPIYRPGETVTITGKVVNVTDNALEGIRVEMMDNYTTILFTDTFSIPARGEYLFPISTTAGAEGIHQLKGYVYQGESATRLAHIRDKYEVANPVISAAASAPPVVGRLPFLLNITVNNGGKVPAALQVDVAGASLADTQSFALQPGETKLVQYPQAISSDTTYEIRLSGDLEQVLSVPVAYGERAAVSLNPQPAYAEGRVAIPLTLSNPGQMEETVEINFQLWQAGAVINQQNKAYALPAGVTVADNLYFDLAEGEYQITAISQLPTANAQASFGVKKENKLNMAVFVGPQAGELIPVAVNLSNLGFSAISGNVLVSVNKQDNVLWRSQPTMVQLPAENSQLLAFNIDPSAILPGSYTLKADLLSNNGQPLGTHSSSFPIGGASFQITQVPPEQTFSPGQEATFDFRVKNTGSQGGVLEFNFKAQDLINLTKREWLKAGEERSIPFSFRLPEDLEEKDYFADYEMKGTRGQGVEGSRGQVKYHLAGINIAVRASLDKQYYQEGESAHLTLYISNPNAQSSTLNLFARVNYPGYESNQPFTLNISQTIAFDIPLAKITGEKLFFGIYHESGRSIHLNSLYIYKAGDVITITTEKQVYKPGETVSVAVAGNTSGTLTLTAPNYEETVLFNNTATRSFPLPSTMTAGTYYVSYQLSTSSGQNYTGTRPFDVDGIRVKVKEATLDKAKYAPSDTINLTLSIESNQNLGAILKTWLVDPDKNYTLPQTQNILLATTAPLLTSQNIALNTAKLGLHRLVYGIYADDMLLCSGSAAFDMGEAVILGIATDQAFYPDGREPVTAAVNLYGSGPATLELFLDGQSAALQSVTLAGFTTIQQNMPVIPPGRHTLKAVLTSGGLASAKERSFNYGSGLPDLSLRMFIDQALAGAKMKLNVTVTNQGKSSSSATTLNLYDGPVTDGLLLATFDVKSLAPGEYQTFIFEFDCLGRTGANSVSALIDPAGQVFEFNKGNNEVQIAFTVPEIALETTLSKEVYAPGETVLITGKITNLSRNQVSDYILETEVKNTSGNQVFKDSKNPPAIGGLASVSVDTSWVIEASLPEGVYTISQTLQGRDALTRKIIALKADQDFSIASQVIHQRVETGEAVQYNLTLASLRGFDGVVSLAIKDCPPGFSASFTPNFVSLSGSPAQSTLKMIPTGQVRSGSYAMKVNAAGGGRSHDLDLGLDLTDFQVAVIPGVKNIKQLDGATYTICVTPINGFNSAVTLGVEGFPRGMRANLSASQATLPQNVTLAIATSKWLLPGSYNLSITAKGKVLNHTATVTLMVDKNPAITPGIVTVPGPMNKPIINSFSSKGVLLSQFQAFDRRSSTHIATGDVDGDGMDEIITGVGWATGRSPSFVGIFKKDGTPVALLGTEQKSGITIAAGDIDGDWVEEVAVGYHYHPNRISAIEDDINDWLLGNEWDEDGYCARYHRGGLGIIKVYKVMGRKFIDTGLVLYPYESEGYRGTPNIAIADVDGDGKPELITAPGPDPSAPARIKIFKIDTSEGMGKWKVAFPMFDVIVPFEKIKVPKKEDKKDGGWSVHIEGYGANIAAGDLDGDGKAEIIVGAGPDPRKNGQVIILRMVDGLYTMESFIAYEGTGYGVYVSAADLDGDGKAEIITGLGPGPRNKPIVRIFRGDGTLIGEFQAYPDHVKFGVRVSGGGVGD